MYDFLSAADRDGVIAPLLRERLEPLGLHEITSRRWVDGSRPPVKRLFDVALQKGVSVKVCWGFSLDFVPHVSGKAVRWHRSNKTAMLDIIVDPAGLPQPTYMFGIERFRTDFAEALPRAVGAAQRDWERGSTYDGMLAIIREIRDGQTNLLGFQNYTQLPLAFAFLLAKTGELAIAEKELDEYLAGGLVEEAPAAKLRELLRKSANAA